MKLPNWFRIIWWLVLTTALSGVLWVRWADLQAGRAVPLDIVVFLVWCGLMLAPIFTEVRLLGLVTLRQEVQKFRDEVKNELATVKAEVRTVLDIRNTFTPQIVLPAPVPDAQLPALEERVRAAVESAVRAYGLRPPAEPAREIAAPVDAQFLFSVRHNIERELRRIARARDVLPEPERRVTSIQLLRLLVDSGLLSADLASAIREVHIICSQAIHAENVTEAQVSFVRDVAADLLRTLRAVA